MWIINLLIKRPNGNTENLKKSWCIYTYFFNSTWIFVCCLMSLFMLGIIQNEGLPQLITWVKVQNEIQWDEIETDLAKKWWLTWSMWLQCPLRVQKKCSSLSTVMLFNLLHQTNKNSTFALCFLHCFRVNLLFHHVVMTPSSSAVVLEFSDWRLGSTCFLCWWTNSW